jgi:hypothetical protein
MHYQLISLGWGDLRTINLAKLTIRLRAGYPAGVLSIVKVHYPSKPFARSAQSRSLLFRPNYSAAEGAKPPLGCLATILLFCIFLEMTFVSLLPRNTAISAPGVM